MNWKLMTVTAGIVFFVWAFSGCTKQSEDKLTHNKSCDTVNVKYSVQIVSILEDNCYQCHGNGSTFGSGGIALYTYAQLKAYADHGDLMGDINHAPGFIGMPYLLPSLPDCERSTFAAWVNQGAPFN
jgi:uncharacterized membrane protein